ncbi:unnamed protein product [Cuscuta campestris]|uniref:Uncharacterized protein n=1 Tax=Cuscuta campestris TaxID=132261 RepID=A0A484KPV2_9ASTE|nr:unnamed protein product [Cuscuta campestris]
MAFDESKYDVEIIIQDHPLSILVKEKDFQTTKDASAAQESNAAGCIQIILVALFPIEVCSCSVLDSQRSFQDLLALCWQVGDSSSMYKDS